MEEKRGRSRSTINFHVRCKRVREIIPYASRTEIYQLAKLCEKERKLGYSHGHATGRRSALRAVRKAVRVDVQKLKLKEEKPKRRQDYDPDRYYMTED